MITTRWLTQPESYQQIWDAMRDFTESRDDTTPDQIWLLEHAPVYTLGTAGKAEHILNSASIPVVFCDRGGQVTYHGPGQVTAYCLIDLHRYGLFAREYVALLENVLADLLRELGLTDVCTMPGAPGVYVPLSSQSAAMRPVNEGSFTNLAKIGALGIKIRKGCTYHGLALNVDMDLTPFSGINPCGYQGMPTTDLRSCGVSLTVQEVGDLLAARLAAAFIDYGRCKARQETFNHDNRQSASTRQSHWRGRDADAEPA